MHCSSAGEFEQGKPLIQSFRERYPTHKVLVSFFSPSGYAVGEKYTGADYVTYLPLDTPNNAKRFVRAVNPEIVLFIKYEFWHHHLRAVAHRHVPILLVGAVFRPEQVFFKPYGEFFTSLLFLFRQIFVQDRPSAGLLERKGLPHVSVAGDPRFDRVWQIAREANEVPHIKEFIGDHPVVVAGSTWGEDDKLIAGYAASHPNLKLIVAPHETNKKNLAQLQRLFPNYYRYSFLQQASQSSPLLNRSHSGQDDFEGSEADVKPPSAMQNAQVLVIDSVGLLSRLYQYASVAYVGGGFTKDGIHNVLEAAVWGKPVVFGPNYKKYREASDLVAANGSFSVSNAAALQEVMDRLLTNAAERQQSGTAAAAYVQSATGATENVMAWIQEKRLLTNP